jgi:hypothetical protein
MQSHRSASAAVYSPTSNSKGTKTVKTDSVTKTECMQQGVGEWGTGSCQTNKVFDKATKSYVVQCSCTLLSTTTIMDSVTDVFVTTNIGSTFGSKGLTALSNFEFWRYAIFYIAMALTIMFVVFGVVGAIRDKR